MNTKAQIRVAAALVVAPMVIGFINHLLGGRSLTTSMTYSMSGPFVYPTRLSLEVYSFGVVLLPMMAAGLVWLSLLSLRLGLPESRLKAKNA